MSTRVTLTEAQARQLAANAINASVPVGLGFLQSSSKEYSPDDVSRTLSSDCIDIDYFHGRMVKLYIKRFGNEYVIPEHEPRSDYQSWVTRYPTYQALFDSVLNDATPQQSATSDFHLTSTAVRALLIKCIFRDEESTENAIWAEGIRYKFGFHPERLMDAKEEIRKLLYELPDDFRKEIGGGWSFLNACMDRHGRQWGEQQDVEVLMALGIGTGQADYTVPRDKWSSLPGGMPYFYVSI